MNPPKIGTLLYLFNLRMMGIWKMTENQTYPYHSRKLAQLLTNTIIIQELRKKISDK